MANEYPKQGSFGAKISDWVAQTKARQDAVFQYAAEELLSEVVRPGPSVANPDSFGGGNMPIDTGFLASSLSVEIGTGLAPLRTNPGGKHSFDASALAVVISNAKWGDTLTASFAANYAIVMEARYAFVRLAAQRWPEIVTDACKQAEASVKTRS